MNTSPQAVSEFAGRRVGHELDLLYALPNLIKDRGPAPKKSVAITCSLYTARAAIEQANAQCELQPGDRL